MLAELPGGNKRDLKVPRTNFYKYMDKQITDVIERLRRKYTGSAYRELLDELSVDLNSYNNSIDNRLRDLEELVLQLKCDHIGPKFVETSHSKDETNYEYSFPFIDCPKCKKIIGSFDYKKRTVKWID